MARDHEPTPKATEQPRQVEHAPEIEVVRRFVEQQELDGGRAREDADQRCPDAFAGAQGRERPLRESEGETVGL